MCAARLESESTISHLVEAMLPRFSDDKLGLMVQVDLSVYDYGYGDDGNTLERDELSVREYIHFLFVRSSNYTKVFHFTSKDNTNPNPLWMSSILTWDLVSDHDSCWRDGFGRVITETYFKMRDEFKGRKKSGRDLNWSDLSEFNTLFSDPSYVQLDVFEQKNKQAERFSTEGRIWNIKFHQINHSKLEMIESSDPKEMSSSGLLIKGSETHGRYMTYLMQHNNSDKVKKVLN